MYHMDMYLNSKRPKYKKFFKSLFLWIIEIILVIFVAWLIIEYAVEKTTMMGVSMNTTLNDGDKIIINKLVLSRASLLAQSVNNLPVIQETLV